MARVEQLLQHKESEVATACFLASPSPCTNPPPPPFHYHPINRNGDAKKQAVCRSSAAVSLRLSSPQAARTHQIHCTHCSHQPPQPRSQYHPPLRPTVLAAIRHTYLPKHPQELAWNKWAAEESMLIAQDVKHMQTQICKTTFSLCFTCLDDVSTLNRM